MYNSASAKVLRLLAIEGLILFAPSINGCKFFIKSESFVPIVGNEPIVIAANIPTTASSAAKTPTPINAAGPIAPTAANNKQLADNANINSDNAVAMDNAESAGISDNLYKIKPNAPTTNVIIPIVRRDFAFIDLAAKFRTANIPTIIESDADADSKLAESTLESKYRAAAKAPIDTVSTIIVPICFPLIDLVAYVNAANIAPTATIARVAAAKSPVSIPLKTLMAPAIINIDAENASIIKPTLPASFALVPISLVAAIIPTIIPRRAATAIPPLISVPISMLPRIATAVDINNIAAPSAVTIPANLGISLANNLVAAIIPTIIPRNAAIANPPFISVSAFILPRMATAADISSNDVERANIVRPNLGISGANN